jgi:hypothetical protein
MSICFEEVTTEKIRTWTAKESGTPYTTFGSALVHLDTSTPRVSGVTVSAE